MHLKFNIKCVPTEIAIMRQIYESKYIISEKLT